MSSPTPQPDEATPPEAADALARLAQEALPAQRTGGSVQEIPLATPVLEKLMGLAGQNAGDHGQRQPPVPAPRPMEPMPTIRGEPPVEIGSASGFVGMLARGFKSSADSMDGVPPPAGTQAPGKPARPQPRTPASRTKTPPDSGAIATSSVHTARPHAPNWYAVAGPLMATLSGLLAVVGIWAIGGSIALAVGMEGVPLVHPLAEDQTADFWYYVPYVMLLCLPVSAGLGVMSVMMRRQMRGR